MVEVGKEKKAYKQKLLLANTKTNQFYDFIDRKHGVDWVLFDELDQHPPIAAALARCNISVIVEKKRKFNKKT